MEQKPKNLLGEIHSLETSDAQHFFANSKKLPVFLFHKEFLLAIQKNSLLKIMNLESVVHLEEIVSHYDEILKYYHFTTFERSEFLKQLKNPGFAQIRLTLEEIKNCVAANLAYARKCQYYQRNDYWQALKCTHEKNPRRLEKIIRLQQSWSLQGDYAPLTSVKLVQLVKVISWIKQYIPAALVEISQLRDQEKHLPQMGLYQKYAEYLQHVRIIFEKEFSAVTEAIFNRLEVAFCSYDLCCDDVLWGLWRQLDLLGLEKLQSNAGCRREMNAVIVSDFFNFIFSQGQTCIERLQRTIAKIVPKKYLLKEVWYDEKWLMLPECFLESPLLQLTMKEKVFFEDKFNRINGLVNVALLVNNGGKNSFFDENRQIRQDLIERSFLACEAMFEELRLVSVLVEDRELVSEVSLQWQETLLFQCLEVFSCLINRIDWFLDHFLEIYEAKLRNSNVDQALEVDSCAFPIISLLDNFFIKISGRNFQNKMASSQAKLALIVEISQKYILKCFFQKIQTVSLLRYLPSCQNEARIYLPDLQQHLGSIKNLLIFLNEKNTQIITVIVEWCEGRREREGFTFVECLTNLFSMLTLSEIEKQNAIDVIIKIYLLPQLTGFDSVLGNVIRLLKGELWYQGWQLECENKIKQMFVILKFVLESKPELLLSKSYRIDFPQQTLRINFFIIKTLLLRLKALKDQRHLAAKEFFKIINKYLVCYHGDNDHYAVLFEILDDEELLRDYVVKFFSSNLTIAGLGKLLNSKQLFLCFKYTSIKRVCVEMLFSYMEDFFSQSGKKDFDELVLLYDTGLALLIEKFSSETEYQIFLEKRDLRVFRHLRMIFSLCKTKSAETYYQQWLVFCQKYSIQFPMDPRVRDQWTKFLDFYHQEPWNGICHRLIEHFAEAERLQKYCLKWLEDFLCPGSLESQTLILPCEQFVTMLLDPGMGEQVLRLIDHCLRENLQNILHQRVCNPGVLEYVGQILAFEFLETPCTEKFVKVRQQYRILCKFLNTSVILRDQVLEVVNQLQLQNYPIVVDYFKNYFCYWLSMSELEYESNPDGYLSFFVFWRQLARMLELHSGKLLCEFVDWLDHNFTFKNELVYESESLKRWVFLYLSQTSLMQNNQEVLLFLNLMTDLSRTSGAPIFRNSTGKNIAAKEMLTSGVDVKNLAVLTDYLQCFSLERFDPEIWKNFPIDDLQVNVVTKMEEISSTLVAILTDFLDETASTSYPACFCKFFMRSLFESADNNGESQVFSKWSQCLSAIVLANPLDRSSRLWHRFAGMLNVVLGVMQNYESCRSHNKSTAFLVEQITQLGLKIKLFLDRVFLTIMREKNGTWAYSLSSMRLIYQSNSVYFEDVLARLPDWARLFAANMYLNQLFGLEEVFAPMAEEIIEIELEKNLGREDVLRCKAVFDIAKTLVDLQEKLKDIKEFFNFHRINKYLSFLLSSLCWIKNSFLEKFDKQYDDIFAIIVRIRSYLNAQKVLHFKEAEVFSVSNDSLIPLGKTNDDALTVSKKILHSKNNFFCQSRKNNTETQGLKRVIAAIVALAFEGLQRFDHDEDFQLIVDSLHAYCGHYLSCFMDPIFFHQHLPRFVDKLSKAYVNQLIERKISAKISFVVNNYNPYALFKNRKFVYSSPSINCENKDRETFKKIIGEIGLQVCQAYGLTKTRSSNNCNANISRI